jgi:hypothetical protein
LVQTSVNVTTVLNLDCSVPISWMVMVTNLKLIHVARNFSIQRLRKPDGIEKLVWGGGLS